LNSGLAGTVLVYKIAGALAQRGGSLDQVEALAKFVAKNIATFGVGLEHCHVNFLHSVLLGSGFLLHLVTKMLDSRNRTSCLTSGCG
jgi:Dak1 domain